MKNIVSTTVLAAAFAAASAGAGAAAEGTLLCHVVGVDNTINSKYYVNGAGEAERQYTEVHGLAYDLATASRSNGDALHPQDYVFYIQEYLSSAYFDARRGVEQVLGGVGGAFIYDIELTENPDGTAAGKYVRGLLPDMVTCEPIQLDG